jgi:tetratricopeptide (TPR) repeat protein
MVSGTRESLLERARIAKQERRLEDATVLFRRALAENGNGEDRALQAVLYEELAYVERNLRDLEAAERHYREASEIYRSLGNPLKRPIRCGMRRISYASRANWMRLRLCMPSRWESTAKTKTHRVSILRTRFVALRCSWRKLETEKMP